MKCLDLKKMEHAHVSMFTVERDGEKTWQCIYTHAQYIRGDGTYAAYAKQKINPVGLFWLTFLRQRFCVKNKGFSSSHFFSTWTSVGAAWTQPLIGGLLQEDLLVVFYNPLLFNPAISAGDLIKSGDWWSQSHSNKTLPLQLAILKMKDAKLMLPESTIPQNAFFFFS